MAVSHLDRIVGSFSTGAANNPTVAMMDAAFADGAMPWRYVNCEVAPDDLAAAVRGAAAMGWAGFNCSMPHKQTVIPLLDRLSPTASICQAVNCVVREASGWVGHNTDGLGFVAALAAFGPVTGSDVLVLGTGGAASAIAVELGRAGAATVHLAGRSPARTGDLARLVQRSTDADTSTVSWTEPIEIPPGVGIVVNATPVGSTPRVDEVIDLDWSTLATDAIVADVIVNPTDTAFLQQARAVGATTIDGTGMLVNQAAENIRLWSGVNADLEVMRRALLSGT